MSDHALLVSNPVVDFARSEDPTQAALTLVDLIKLASSSVFTLFASADLWATSSDGQELSEWLWSPSAIGRDARLALGIELSKLQTRDQGPGLHVGLLRVSQSDADLAPPTADPNCFAVAVSGVVSLALFARHAIRCDEFSIGTFEFVSRTAFPRLDFVHGIWRQVRRFDGGLANTGPRLLTVLEGLNDFAPSVWRQETQPHLIEARMRAEAGVDCSRESSNTHNNSAAMSERRVSHGGEIIECEWHAKLEPHRNRVHFAVSGGRVLIGIFADHLTV